MSVGHVVISEEPCDFYVLELQLNWIAILLSTSMPDVASRLIVPRAMDLHSTVMEGAGL